MPGFLSPGKGVPLLLIPEYSGINKDQRIPDRSKTAHRKLPVKLFLTNLCPEKSDVRMKSTNGLEQLTPRQALLLIAAPTVHHGFSHSLSISLSLIA